MTITSNLPERCYAYNMVTGEVILVARGESGYWKSNAGKPATEAEARQVIDQRNEELGVSKAQASAMSAGSLFGWDCPAADPDIYDENGEFKKG